LSFKFLHTADLHLESPLKSLALRDEGLADLIGNATRTVLTRIVDLCITEEVNALLIVGDLYDGAQTSMKTARFLAQEMVRLAEAEIPVFLIRGNHDAMSRITRELILPESVKVFSGRAEFVETNWNGHDVVVHGISFRLPQVPDTLLDHFHTPVPGAFNIGLLHTSLGGAPGHDLYAPCSLVELQATKFDYWALGHIHQRAAFPGPTTVVMPGIPQGRDIGEAGEKTVTLVTVGDDGAVALEEHALAVAQFERVQVAGDGLDDWGDLVTVLQSTLSKVRRANGAEHLIVRPVVIGVSPLSWRARRDVDLLRTEAQSAAESIGSLWIDKLEIALEEGAESAPGGPIGELATLIEADMSGSLQIPTQDALDALVKKLPRELRHLFGDTEEDVAAACQEAMRQGALELLARLDAEEV
jgi:exonuclease SbcD